MTCQDGSIKADLMGKLRLLTNAQIGTVPIVCPDLETELKACDYRQNTKK